MIMATALHTVTSRTAGGSARIWHLATVGLRESAALLQVALFTDPVRLKAWIQTTYRQLSLPAVLFLRFHRAACVFTGRLRYDPWQGFTSAGSSAGFWARLSA